MTPRHLCSLQCMILVLALEISLMVQHMWNGFRVWGRWQWWLFLEVIPCRLNGPTATLPGTSGMFLSGDARFSGPECSSHQSFLIPCSQCLGGAEELFEKPGWLVRWQMKTCGSGPCLWPLGRGHKALSGFGQGGEKMSYDWSSFLWYCTHHHAT